MTVKKRRIKVKIGELLLEKQSITKEQLADALNLQRTKYKGKALGEILCELGYVKEDEVCSALAMQLGHPYIKIANCVIDAEVLDLVPAESSRRLRLMPVDRIGNIFTIAMLNPLEEASLKEIEGLTGLKVKAFVTTPSELTKAQVEYYGRE